MSHKLHKKTDEKIKSRKAMTNLIGNCYLIYIFGFLPLVMNDGFFDITGTKYMFFACGTLVAVATMAIAVRKNGQSFSCVTESAGIRIYALFLLICVTGALVSDYTSEAFTGSLGRYRGVNAFVLYLGVFFVMQFMDEWYKSTVCIAGVTAFLVFILGICNSVTFDPLQTFAEIHPWDYEKFTSTMGQVDIFSEYCGIVLAALVACRCFKQTLSRIERICWSLLYVSGTMALFCNNSDTGHLALAVALLVSCLAVRDKNGLVQIAYCLFLYAVTGMMWIFLCNHINVKEVQGVNGMLLSHPGFFILSAMAAALMFLLCRWCPFEKLKKTSTIGILTAGVIGTGYVLLANLFDELPLWSALKWGPEWGSMRGRLWMVSWDIFRTFSWKNKLFGAGADNLAPLYSNYQIEIGYEYDSAHNCILQLLLGVGLVGTLLWMLLVGYILFSVLKKIRKNQADSFLIICFIVFMAYLPMSLIGIQLCYTEVFAVIAAGCLMKTCSRNVQAKRGKL